MKIPKVGLGLGLGLMFGFNEEWGKVVQLEG
jgi:hypothetical protein